MDAFQQVSREAKIEGEILKWGKCICGVCNKKGKLGTTTAPTPQRPVARILCIDCALKEMAERHGISIKEAKEKHERHQKSQEILAKVILERYKEETGKSPPKNLEGLAEVMQPGITWWNQSLSDRERDEISALSKDEQKARFREAPVMPAPQKPVVKTLDVGRNDPCPCQSGKKFKKCCIDKMAA